MKIFLENHLNTSIYVAELNGLASVFTNLREFEVALDAVEVIPVADGGGGGGRVAGVIGNVLFRVAAVKLLQCRL